MRNAGGPFPDLTVRAHIRERMDDPGCDETRLLRTVRRFRLLNRLVSRYRFVLQRWLIRDMLARPDRTYRVADLGAGGCDIPVWLLGRARRLGLKVSVLAVESDERIAAYARRTYRSVPGLTIACRDATDLTALGPLDYLLGNHFLHHLSDGEIRALLTRALDLPLRRFVFVDLRRSYAAYYAHGILAPLFFPRTFVGTDGRRSIRRGFRPSELRSLLQTSGIAHRISVRTLAPARVVVVGPDAAPD
jgi:hypothetical protein